MAPTRDGGKAMASGDVAPLAANTKLQACNLGATKVSGDMAPRAVLTELQRLRFSEVSGDVPPVAAL